MSRITSAWSSQPRQLAVASEARRNAADAAITMKVARTGRRVSCGDVAKYGAAPADALQQPGQHQAEGVGDGDGTRHPCGDDEEVGCGFELDGARHEEVCSWIGVGLTRRRCAPGEAFPRDPHDQTGERL